MRFKQLLCGRPHWGTYEGKIIKKDDPKLISAMKKALSLATFSDKKLIVRPIGEIGIFVEFGDKKIIAVKIDSQNETPLELYGIGAKWAMSFTFDSIKKAIDEA